VDADEAAAVAEVALERPLLRVGEDIAGGVQEDDRSVAGELLVDELVCFVSGLDRERPLLAEVADRLHAGRRRCVLLADGSREDEDAEFGLRGRRAGTAAGSASTAAARAANARRTGAVCADSFMGFLLGGGSAAARP
jgi:hypothetical protein